MREPSLSDNRPTESGNTSRVFSRRDLALSTDKGIRENNEDFCGYRVSADRSVALIVLSDGMGGHASGEVASTLAVETMLEDFEQSQFPWDADQLHQSVLKAHDLILQTAADDERKQGMGATLVAALLNPGSVTVCHVGDSRAFQFRDACVRRLTQDHLIVVDVLGLADNQAKNHPQGHVLSQALGARDDVHPATTQFDLASGDWIVLCSDGVSEYINEPRMYRMLTADGALEQAAARIVREAIHQGSRDNCSVVAALVP